MTLGKFGICVVFLKHHSKFVLANCAVRVYLPIPEMVAPMKRREAELEVGLKMFGFALGVNRLGRVRNEYTRQTAQVGQFRDKVRR